MRSHLAWAGASSFGGGVAGGVRGSAAGWDRRLWRTIREADAERNLLYFGLAYPTLTKRSSKLHYAE